MRLMNKMVEWLEGKVELERGTLLGLMLIIMSASVLSHQIYLEVSERMFHATYEVYEELYTVRPGDTFWDITEYYCAVDDREIYLPSYQYEVINANPALEARHCQVNPGDLIRIKYYKLKH